MHDLPSYLLQAYFRTTDWHPYNSYLHLTSHSSSILLDFPIPNGLSFSVSSAPSPIFYSTHRLRALPNLAGSLGYVVSRTEKPLELGRGGGVTGQVKLRDALERFRIVSVPRKPAAEIPTAQTLASSSSSSRSESMTSGKADEVERDRDYLLYGCLHSPSARLDALFTTRISPTWNFIMTACSFPPRPPPFQVYSDASQQQVYQQTGPPIPGATNLQAIVQNDTGKWFNEFSYSVDDSLWGFRTMHHFGPSKRANGPQVETFDPYSSYSDRFGISRPRNNLRADEDPSPTTEVGGGLKGRFSAGAELFFSAAEKSAGLSTGVRFTTLPEEDGTETPTAPAMLPNHRGGSPASVVDASTSFASASSFNTEFLEDSAVTMVSPEAYKPPSQPPTTITATLNPMMGHLSTAYAAKMGRDVVACSRFDFNVYSYESELTVGGEYWLRSSPDTASEGTSLSSTLASAASSTASYLSSDDTFSSTLYPPRTELSARPLPPDVSLRERREILSDAPATLSPPRELTLRESFASLSSSTPPSPSSPSSLLSASEAASVPVTPRSSTSGLLKWSLTSSFDLSLLWQGRIRNCLVAVGIKADLAGGAGLKGGRSGQLGTRGGVGNLVKGIGMDVVYWGGGGSGSSSGASGTSASSSLTVGPSTLSPLPLAGQADPAISVP